MKRTVEIEDTLQERVDSAIDDVKDVLMEYLKENSTLLYLNDSFENIEEKLTNVFNRGIVGFKSKSLRQIYVERRALYLKYAEITISCQGKSWDMLVKEILLYFSALRINTMD